MAIPHIISFENANFSQVQSAVRGAQAIVGHFHDGASLHIIPETRWNCFVDVNFAGRRDTGGGGRRVGSRPA